MKKYHYPIRGMKIAKLGHDKGHSYYRSRKNPTGVLAGFPNQGDHSGGWESAYGIDFIGYPNRTKVLAVTDGILKQVKISTYEPNSGWSLHLMGDDGSEWYYTHITKPHVTNYSRTGDKSYYGTKCNGKRVYAGTVIAKVAPYPSNTPHLHISKKYGHTDIALLPK